MKRKLKFGGTIVLGAVFAAAVLCSSFCQPFIPDAVYEAVPAQVTVKCKVESLDELLESPVCGQLDTVLGAGNSLKAVLDSNGRVAPTDHAVNGRRRKSNVGGWVKLAAPSEIVVMDLPLRHAGQTKTWAAVSWVGWRSPWLRWKLEHSRAKGLSFLGKHAVWPIWKYETPNIARGMSLTFALTDNLFMVCLSENPADILLLLDTYDRRIPSVKNPK